MDAERDLAELIAEWFDAQRRVYLEAAGRAGVPASVDIWVPVAKEYEDDPHRLSTEHELRRVSPLFTRNLAISITRGLGEANVEPPEPLVERVVRDYGLGAAPFGVFGTGTVEAIERMFGSAADDYLAELQSLEVGDPQLAREHAEDLVRLFAADTVELVTAVALAGIRVEQRIECGDVLLRPILAEELGRLSSVGSYFFQLPAPRRSIRLWNFIHGGGERVVLETRERCAKDKQAKANSLQLGSRLRWNCWASS